jgi:hypothetical protein
MKDILLPKGIKKLKDKDGKEVDYDIPLPVFSPGSEAGILEQLVLSLYFRGGDAVIDRPYVVRQVKQPLTKFFINQLCLWNISRLRTDTLEGAAEYIAAEHILVAPNILSGKILETQRKFENLKALLKKDNSKATPQEIKNISDLLDKTITPCTIYMDARVIPILYDFQKEYKKPNNPHLAVILDCYRRIVDKSLQGTQNSSMTTISKLVEQFEKSPSIQNARLIDIFARRHKALGFKEDRNGMYTKVRNAYLKCITSEFDISDRVTSYASLIIFEKILGLDDEAAQHVLELENLKIPQEDSRKNTLRNIFVAKGRIKIAPENISKLGIIGLEEYYNEDLLKIIYCRLRSYEKVDGQKVLASYPVDLMENLVEHAKLTKLTDIFYDRNSQGNLNRNFVFNQIPYVHVKDELSILSANDRCIIRQSVPGDYFGLLEKMLNPVRGYMKHGKVYGELDLKDMLLTDIDRYLFRVPDIRQAEHSPGSSMVVRLPTKPILNRHGPNGEGLIETEKYQETQKS